MSAVGQFDKPLEFSLAIDQIIDWMLEYKRIGHG
jgi:hypothetical protein